MSHSSVIVGDCRRVLNVFADDTFDSVVTDPPYGLQFMGREWDRAVPGVDFWQVFLRVAKPGAYLLAFGGSRTSHRMACAIEDAGWQIRDTIMWLYGSGFPKGDNLKPAHEPIILARKPGRLAGLNIDACRVESSEIITTHSRGTNGAFPKQVGAKMQAADQRIGLDTETERTGRYPANVIHDGSDEVLDAFPDAPGQIANASKSDTLRAGQNVYGEMRRGRGAEPSADSDNTGVVGFKMKPGDRQLDAGSAARFFYCAKASKADRGEGNTHPTVKPHELMRYLCRLVTPPGGLILDPFGGSGSTGKAAMAEGFDSMLIELEDEHAAIAERRIA